jgi:hypothetical protein
MNTRTQSHPHSFSHLASRSIAVSIAVVSLLSAGCKPDSKLSPVEPNGTAATARRADQSDLDGNGRGSAKHVLLISIDGFHATDLTHFIASNPSSALAKLAKRGTSFLNASTSKPSDSFPGLLAMLTGASPKVTGVYYDDSYDRLLSSPGSNCATRGTEVVYDESIDINSDQLDAGGGIDPAKLPRDGSRGCTPVFPHQFLRVNTIFEVAKAAGLRTAWSDKHPAYEIVNGPSGQGVDDLFNPEVASVGPSGTPTDNVPNAEAYDDIKVAAVLNQIAGKDHTGNTVVGTPAIFGMNFQAVSVGQKTVGYLDAAGTPSAALADALRHTDASIGSMIRALQVNGLVGKTLVIISAKHGQAPIDLTKRRIISSKLIPAAVNGVASGLVAQATEDDVALLWLTNQGLTSQAVAALFSQQQQLGIESILSGAPLVAMFGDPTMDPRTPDLIALPVNGVIYTSPTATKTAEHGGFSRDDTNVPILVAGPGVDDGINMSSVRTTQIAPTILRALGLNPNALRGVQLEGTQALPIQSGDQASNR